MRNKNIALSSLLLAVSLVLSYLEGFIPFPVPGFKLGLANIAILVALYTMGPLCAFVICILKCLFSSLFSFGITAFLFSLAGGLLSLFVMIFLKKYFSRSVSIYGVSIAGAAFHNLGQIIIASVIMETSLYTTYLPILLLLSVISGAVTSVIARASIKAVNASKGT
ncbi:MAG: Gx transporter family protein [Clostridiales bacterium]|nr:Gx transporter family protein [Clostridiales bacterium]